MTNNQITDNETIKPTKVRSYKPKVTHDPKELTCDRDWLDMLDSEALSLFPGRDEIRKRVSYTLLKWSDSEDAIEIGQFCKKFRIPFTTLKAWVSKYPDLAEAYNTAKYNIAVNRKVGTITKRYDGAYAYKDMHVLDPDWDAINRYHADLKKSETPEHTTFRIIGVDGIPLDEGGKLPKPQIISKEEMAEGFKRQREGQTTQESK